MVSFVKSLDTLGPTRDFLGPTCTYMYMSTTVTSSSTKYEKITQT